MSAPALNVTGVHKIFGAVTAARDISVKVPEGAVYSLIGANGASMKPSPSPASTFSTGTRTSR